jgi:hypothetical protein
MAQAHESAYVDDLGDVDLQRARSLGVMPALISPMMFDSEAATRQLATKILFASVLGFPILCLAALLIGWYVYKHGDPRIGVLIAYLPILDLLAFAVTCVYIGAFKGGSLAG